jgi:rhodanese-related sulfurtransferase
MKQFARLYSPVKIISKNSLANLIHSKKNDYTLIDVRNPDETRVNLIETAHKIPLPEFADAFSLDNTTFQHKYGFSRPTLDDRIVLYCRSGAKSGSAADHLQKLGYTNVENYKGSANEWFGV